MADKGFTTEDILPVGFEINMPPRIPGQRQMTAKEFYQTQGIASARVVVEMKMEQFKNYTILSGTLRCLRPTLQNKWFSYAKLGQIFF